MILALLLTLAQADPLPAGSTLVCEETWVTGKIDPERWYTPRKMWGKGNNGVVPENVRVVKEGNRTLLVCEARGDAYDGPGVGYDGGKGRVGGVLVSKSFYASGRFEVVLRIVGRPAGCVPAIWTYASRGDEFLSELDFPEFGKGGNFEKALYNAYCQTQEETAVGDVSSVSDGGFHTLTTDWRTRLDPIEGVTDAQVKEQGGYWWVQDRAVPFERYRGNPLKRLEKDRYAVYCGVLARHWVDGKKTAENTKAVPCMAAQLTLGVWLPNWAGPAAWKTASVSFASIKVWQYGDPGDVRGVLTEDLKDNFEAGGTPRKAR
jgi:hypothetical protein